MYQIPIRFDGYEYRVPGPAGTLNEPQAYYTDDRQDAFDTARCEHGTAVRFTVRRVDVLDPNDTTGA